jgi:hypothetical protein
MHTIPNTHHLKTEMRVVTETILSMIMIGMMITTITIVIAIIATSGGMPYSIRHMGIMVATTGIDPT